VTGVTAPAAIDVLERPDGSVLVSVPRVPALGYASSTPIPSYCPDCKKPGASTISELFTNIYQRVATQRVILYASINRCERCRGL
jgi:hypothetical protein